MEIHSDAAEEDVMLGLHQDEAGNFDDIKSIDSDVPGVLNQKHHLNTEGQNQETTYVGISQYYGLSPNPKS